MRAMKDLWELDGNKIPEHAMDHYRTIETGIASEKRSDTISCLQNLIAAIWVTDHDRRDSVSPKIPTQVSKLYGMDAGQIDLRHHITYLDLPPEGRVPPIIFITVQTLFHPPFAVQDNPIAIRIYFLLTQLYLLHHSKQVRIKLKHNELNEGALKYKCDPQKWISSALKSLYSPNQRILFSFHIYGKQQVSL